MTAVMQDMTYIYMQTGFIGLFFIVVMALVIWYFTKGRKQQQDEREKLVKEQASIRAVIDNNTAVINNNSKVIEANTVQRQDEKRCLDRLDERMDKHGEQLDLLLTNQTVCMDRQNRK